MTAVAPTWEELYRQVPDELRPYVLEVDWDRERLWRLELPVENMKVDVLAWQLVLPWWRDGDRYFSVRPLDVLTIPNPHREHFERAMDADLAHALDVTLRNGSWAVLDGVHRLLKAVALGEPTVRVRKLPAEAVPLIAAA